MQDYKKHVYFPCKIFTEMLWRQYLASPNTKCTFTSILFVKMSKQMNTFEHLVSEALMNPILETEFSTQTLFL